MLSSLLFLVGYSSLSISSGLLRRRQWLRYVGLSIKKEKEEAQVRPRGFGWVADCCVFLPRRLSWRMLAWG